MINQLLVSLVDVRPSDQWVSFNLHGYCDNTTKYSYPMLKTVLSAFIESIQHGISVLKKRCATKTNFFNLSRFFNFWT